MLPNNASQRLNDSPLSLWIPDLTERKCASEINTNVSYFRQLTECFNKSSSRNTYVSWFSLS